MLRFLLSRQTQKLLISGLARASLCACALLRPARLPALGLMGTWPKWPGPEGPTIGLMGWGLMGFTGA